MNAAPRQTVLITGALGQDGSLLAERLAAEGHRVIGLVRPGQGSGAIPPAVPPAGAAAGIEPVGIDLGDPAAIDTLVEAVRPDRVFHVAAAHHASDVPLTADTVVWRAMTTVNFLATTFLIQAILARAPQARLVYAASSQMYRPAPGGALVDEDSHRDPPTYYGLTKSWSMDAIRFARERHGLHGSTAILFNHESPRRPEAFVSRKIAVAAAGIKLGLAEGLRLRNIGAEADWCDAEDVVDALVRMGEAGTPDDYIVGSGTLVPVRSMVEAAFDAAGLDWRRHVACDEDVPRPAVRANPGKIGRQLGWSPRTGITDVLRRMVAADLARLSAAAPPR